MKYLLILLLVFVTGCTTVVPVTQKFPDAPQPLLEPCKELAPASETATLSEFTKTVVVNYGTYYQCRTVVEGWHEWYNKQKELFKELK